MGRPKEEYDDVLLREVLKRVVSESGNIAIQHWFGGIETSSPGEGVVWNCDNEIDDEWVLL